MFSKAILALAMIAQVAAYCPNGCSGHGSCGANGKSFLGRPWAVCFFDP